MVKNVWTITRAVNWEVVNGDVVLYQVLCVVQMVYIVALKDIHVMCHKELVHNLTESQGFC